MQRRASDFSFKATGEGTTENEYERRTRKDEGEGENKDIK